MKLSEADSPDAWPTNYRFYGIRMGTLPRRKYRAAWMGRAWVPFRVNLFPSTLSLPSTLRSSFDTESSFDIESQDEMQDEVQTRREPVEGSELYVA